MKRVILLFLLILLYSTTFSQIATDFYPKQTGYKWYFEITPLDSLNNPIPSYSSVRIDSFAVEDTFYGKISNLAVSKSGGINTINSLPYFDSIFVNLENNVALKYLSFLNSIDTSIFSDTAFISYLKELEDWYPVYQFSDGIKKQYSIFSKDTTITFDSTQFPIRIEFFGKQEDDETLVTEIGEFDCKKFVISFRLSYLVDMSPFPTLAIPLLTIPDSVWIAPEKWIVKEFTPSIVLDLTNMGGGMSSVPGYQKISISEIKTAVDDEQIVVSEFKLDQNYPNPFNPSTVIKYSIPTDVRGEKQEVRLMVYDILGNEVATLVNEQKPAGNYSVKFDASNLASGIYLYKLNYGSFMQTKKMLLIK